MPSLTKICILSAILLVAMEVRGENVKTPNEDQNIQMMDEEKEATGDSIDEMEENAENEAEAVDKGEHRNNNALINSIMAWDQVIGKVSSITSQESSAPSTYNQDVISDLLKSLKNCKKAVESLNTCKKGGEGGGTGGKPTKPGGGTGGKPTKPGGGTGGKPTKPGGGTGGKPTKPGGGTGRKPTKPGGGTGRKPTKPGGGTGGKPTKPGGGTGRKPTKPGGGTGRKPPPKPSGGCNELWKKNSKLPSGNYKLQIGGKEVSVYCHMEKLCGFDGGWTRLGYLKMSSDHKTCPNNRFSYINEGGLHLCRIKSGSKGCATASHSSHGIRYKTICGYAREYQKGSPYGFAPKSLNSYYLDGVSIQRYVKSARIRDHVWSYACGSSEREKYKLSSFVLAIQVHM